MIETNRIEFKRELTKDLDIEKEVVAFLNYREGGILYIGIDRYNYVAFLMSDENNGSVKLAKYSSGDRSQLTSVNEYGFTCLLQTADRIIERLKIENTVTSQKTYKERVNTSLWDEKAIREIVMNALIHNDYTDEIPPKFELFADHLEITSSGGLPMGLTLDEFFSGVSKPRNKELMRIFCDVDFGESLGSGMASVMRAYLPENFTFMPHFVRFSVGYINHVVLFKEDDNPENGRINPETEHLTKNAERILRIIAKEEGISVITLQSRINLGERTIFRHIASLIQKHLIERRGSKKTGGYWLVDSERENNKL